MGGHAKLISMLELLIGSVLVFLGTRWLVKYIQRVGQPWSESHVPQKSNYDGIYFGMGLALFLRLAFHLGIPWIVGLCGGGLIGGVVQHLIECKRTLAPGQVWRAHVETLAAQAGVTLKGVQMVNSKVHYALGRPDGTVELSTALLRDAPPDERAFLIGRALWDIHSGYTRRESEKLQKATWLLLGTLGGLALLVFTMAPPVIVPLLFFAVCGTLIAQIYIRARLDATWNDANRFALSLTGDLPAAQRALEAAMQQRLARLPHNDPQRQRILTEEMQRILNLSAWWTARQTRPSFGANASAPLQKLGRP
jgi:hypothetical protein